MELCGREVDGQFRILPSTKLGWNEIQVDLDEVKGASVDEWSWKKFSEETPDSKQEEFRYNVAVSKHLSFFQSLIHLDI